MKVFALLAVLATACSGVANSGSTSSNQGLAAQDGGTCHYPAGVDVNSSPSGPGCFGGPARQICQVSNGATINAEDGGVSGGTESCKSLCGASQYEMTCSAAAVNAVSPDPDSALGCQVIPIPTPSSTLFYCCPCAD
jgi:hypothetical protein